MQCNGIPKILYQYHHKFSHCDDLCKFAGSSRLGQNPKFGKGWIFLAPLLVRNQTWTESCCAILVAQRQAALSSVSFGSLPQGQADTAADTMKGEQSKFQSNTEANATTSALLLPIPLSLNSPLQTIFGRCCPLVRGSILRETWIFLRAVFNRGKRTSSGGRFPVWNWVLLLRPCPTDALLFLWHFSSNWPPVITFDPQISTRNNF